MLSSLCQTNRKEIVAVIPCCQEHYCSSASLMIPLWTLFVELQFVNRGFRTQQILSGYYITFFIQIATPFTEYKLLVSLNFFLNSRLHTWPFYVSLQCYLLIFSCRLFFFLVFTWSCLGVIIWFIDLYWVPFSMQKILIRFE